jgi:hypothetical protein
MSRRLPVVVRDAAIAAIAPRYQVTASEVLSERRTQPIAHARQHIMWALRQEDYSYPEIGRKFGRDHTTAIFAERAHEARTAGLPSPPKTRSGGNSERHSVTPSIHSLSGSSTSVPHAAGGKLSP